MQTAVFVSKLTKEEIPPSGIQSRGDLPICAAKDGITVVVLQWDYAAWTPGAARASNEVGKFPAKPPRDKRVLIALSGQVSPRLRQELEERGQLVKNRVTPGPLK